MNNENVSNLSGIVRSEGRVSVPLNEHTTMSVPRREPVHINRHTTFSVPKGYEDGGLCDIFADDLSMK